MNERNRKTKEKGPPRMHQWNVTAYPTLIEVTPGNLRVVWDSGTSDTLRTHIHFDKLRITP